MMLFPLEAQQLAKMLLQLCFLLNSTHIPLCLPYKVVIRAITEPKYIKVSLHSLKGQNILIFQE